MIVFLLSALIMGAAGSLHCIGMCGPLALSLPLSGTSQGKFVGTLLYNLGRIITYSFIGLLFGLIGSSFKIMGLQRLLSISLGVIIITYLVLPSSIFLRYANGRIQKWFSIIRNQLSKLFRQHNFSSLFFIGILNGLLPCGLVYMAATVSIASGSVLYAVLFMAFFGLGTLPLMWAVSFFGSYFSAKSRSAIRKLYPYMMVCMACILIIRGLGFGIPYLSPAPAQASAAGAIQCHPVK